MPFLAGAASTFDAILNVDLDCRNKYRPVELPTTMHRAIMAQRLTLMDGELIDLQPASLRTRPGRFPVRTNSPKESQRAEQQYATPLFTAANHDANSTKPKRSRKERPVKCFSDESAKSYYNFMPLDQAGPAVIARDNKDRTFVAIKRAKKSGVEPVLRIPDFVSDHVVNIKDMFVDKEEVVIIYEQMDVSLRHIMAVAGGPLQAFEIAAVCKEVRFSLRTCPRMLIQVCTAG